MGLVLVWDSELVILARSIVRDILGGRDLWCRSLVRIVALMFRVLVCSSMSFGFPLSADRLLK